MDYTSALDPNIAALLGSGGGNDKFTQMLMRAINPNAARDVGSALGPPSLSPLMDAAARAPAIATASPQPALGGPQMLQTLGFGMAAAAGKPGSTGLSALGEGGTNVITQGGAASERAIREAQQENSAAISEWEGKNRAAEKALDAQMKGPELDMKMMDLTGQTLARDQSRQDTAAYRAGLLENGASRIGVAQQNADTGKARVGVSQQRADTYGDKVSGDQDLKAQALAMQQQKLDASASQFQQKLLEEAKARGSRIGLDVAQKAAQEFKNEMTLRKNPITGELPDEGTQEALRQSLTAKYASAARGPAAAPDNAVEQAKAAIAAGADPAKVKQRLADIGIDTRGLEF